MKKYQRFFTGIIPDFICAIILILLGGWFIIGCITSDSMNNNFVQTTAEVIQMQDENGITVNGIKYEVDGKTYKGTKLASFSNVGDKIKIYYNPAKPEIYNESNSKDYSSLIFGGVLFLFGVTFLITGINGIKKKRQLIGVVYVDPDDHLNEMNFKN